MKIIFDVDPRLEFIELPEYVYSVAVRFSFPVINIVDGNSFELKNRCEKIMEYAKKELLKTEISENP